MQDLNPLLEHSIDLADRAAKIAMSYFRKALLIEMKDNMTPVTIADKKTEEAIRSELEEVYPDHGIIGEEFGKLEKPTDYIWTVDPIDGTRSFIKGIPLFGTLIGLLYKGEPVLGVMSLPALKETYWAVKGGGTFCNGTQVHVSNTTSLESSFICSGDLACFDEIGKKGTAHNMMDKSEAYRGYTDCFGHSLVIRGAVDAMLDPVVSIWDIAPIATLVTEAGGIYCGFNGNPSIRETNFISCTPKIKDEVLALL